MVLPTSTSSLTSLKLNPNKIEWTLAIIVIQALFSDAAMRLLASEGVQKGCIHFMFLWDTKMCSVHFTTHTVFLPVDQHVVEHLQEDFSSCEAFERIW